MDQETWERWRQEALSSYYETPKHTPSGYDAFSDELKAGIAEAQWVLVQIDTSATESVVLNNTIDALIARLNTVEKADWDTGWSGAVLSHVLTHYRNILESQPVE